MSRFLLLYSLLTGTILNATTVESQLGINVGMTATENSEGSKFKHPTFGLTYQDNSYVVMPRVDLEYVNIKDDNANSLIKGSINGLYEFENRTNASPYLLVGVGYESVQGGVKNQFESHPFIHGGVGLNFLLKKDFKIRIESKILQIIGGENENNEVVVTAGLSFPLSYRKEKTIPKVSRRVAPLKPVIKPIYINSNECSIKTNLPDLDRDGVEDRLDQCPATPCNFTVDHYGCPIKTTLKINFATNSADIYQDSMYRLDNFAKFLLSNRGSMVKIEGHTDNKGSADYNMGLSKRRANAVMQRLIARGVSPSRLSANGYGENMPISTNMTEDGRAMNRRIEAILTYPKGGR